MKNYSWNLNLMGASVIFEKIAKPYNKIRILFKNKTKI